MFFGFDLIHLAILFVGGLLSLAAAGYVKYKFMRGKEVPLRSGMTGAEVARAILRHHDIYDVEVVEHQGFLSDHYNPMEKKLALSPDVYHGRSAAAAGVAAHEVGHAVQHAQGSLSMWLRSILVYPAHFGSMLAPWLVIAGIALGSAEQAARNNPGLAYWLAVGGVGLFGLAFLCALFIVVNEFDASKRARLALANMGITRPGEEDDTVRGVLNAAGLTYVAAAIVAFMELLYWAWRAGLIGGQRRD
ncbi:MAG: zinc metallopeptidase [Planctomycetota bacterium]|nr:zinc metallopeptidase [Planctomycetota bacterium]MDW8373157.1 zinc metallopeptidase [Planctomycetota bacterium]